MVTRPWNFFRICLNKFYAHTGSMKNTAFDNFKLFPENQPPNKKGVNNDKQIKSCETDGAVKNLLYSYQRVMPV